MLPASYKTLDLDGKKEFWSESLYRSMRGAGESGIDETTIFTRNMIAEIKSLESEIDTIMPTVLTRLAVMWMENPFLFIWKLNGQMGTSYQVDRKFLEINFPNYLGPQKKAKSTKKWWHLW